MRAALIANMLLLYCGIAAGGELRLANGALIPGELKRIDAHRVIWKADLIGEISVAKKDVLSLGSTARSDIETRGHGALAGCAVAATGQEARIDCSEGVALTAPLESIETARAIGASSGKITATGRLERGDDHNDEIESDLRSAWQRGQRRHSLDAGIDYEEEDGSTSEDEASLNYQLDFLRAGGWFWFSGVQYNRDRFDSIQESRSLVAGMGRNMKPLRGLSLSAQAGAGLVWLDLADYGRRSAEAGEIKWDGKWDTGLWKIELFHEGEFVWALEDSNVYRLRSRSGVTIPLIDGLVGELRLDYDRTGRVPENLENTDVEWVMALGYRW